MKKLMTLMLGLSLAIGCVGVTFAEDKGTSKPKKEKTKKPAKTKKDTAHKGA